MINYIHIFRSIRRAIKSKCNYIEFYFNENGTYKSFATFKKKGVLKMNEIKQSEGKD